MMINFKILQIYLIVNHLHHHFDSFYESKCITVNIVPGMIMDQYSTIHMTTLLWIGIVNIKLNSVGKALVISSPYCDNDVVFSMSHGDNAKQVFGTRE
jgi:hypothetical protein